MRRTQFVILTVFLGLAAGGFAWTRQHATIVIAHTNDIHGQIEPRDGSGGLLRLATLIRQAGADLLFDGGDMFTGTMLSDQFQGRPLVEIMNRLGYDAAVIGNHEFDYGLDALESRIREASFPFLSANVHGIDGAAPYRVLHVRGARIGVVGLTVENLHAVTHPKNLTTLEVEDPAAALGRALDHLRPQTDFVILLGHLTEAEQLRLARAFPEIRLIIAGHPHVARTLEAGGATIVNTGSNAQYLGRIVMTLEGVEPRSIREERLRAGNAPADPEIAALIEPYRAAVRERAAARLGVAPGGLPRNRTESPLGNLIADAMRADTGADLALHNLGGIRAALPAGPVTYGDLHRVLPFENTLVTVRLTGNELLALLGRSVQAVSGIHAEWDLGRPYPRRLVSAHLSTGAPIEAGRLYTVAVNDFMWAGGDGLAELLQGRDPQDTGRLIRDVVAGYMRGMGTLTPAVDGRAVVRE